MIKFDVKTNIPKVIVDINRFQDNFNERFNNLLNDVSGVGRDYLRRQLLANGNIWTGKLYNSIMNSRKSDTRYIVEMEKYGSDLDSRSPRALYTRTINGRLNSNASIVKWAKTAPNSPYKNRRIPSFILVEKHPFIDKAWTSLLLDCIYNDFYIKQKMRLDDEI